GARGPPQTRGQVGAARVGRRAGEGDVGAGEDRRAGGRAGDGGARADGGHREGPGGGAVGRGGTGGARVGLPVAPSLSVAAAVMVWDPRPSGTVMRAPVPSGP